LHHLPGVHGRARLGVEDVLVELRLDTAGDDLGDAYAERGEVGAQRGGKARYRRLGG
jgi:hypothetical protein